MKIFANFAPVDTWCHTYRHKRYLYSPSLSFSFSLTRYYNFLSEPLAKPIPLFVDACEERNHNSRHAFLASRRLGGFATWLWIARRKRQRCRAKEGQGKREREEWKEGGRERERESESQQSRKPTGSVRGHHSSKVSTLPSSLLFPVPAPRPSIRVTVVTSVGILEGHTHRTTSAITYA